VTESGWILTATSFAWDLSIIAIIIIKVPGTSSLSQTATRRLDISHLFQNAST
jgi:hypothetical protein